MTTGLASTVAVILSRAIRPEAGDLSPDAARSWLNVRLPAMDQERARGLAAKVRDGSSAPDEEAELDSYCVVGRLLELMKSKARLSLQNSKAV